MSSGTPAKNKRSALRFVVLLGIVSLFSDMTYEGARSVTGPYLNLLGASATVVGIVSGAGELLGYALRLISGYLADRTRRYWLLTISGYVINLAVVPMLALTGRWEIAAGLILMERVGKAIRTPARDAMLSHASSEAGAGWTFGLHEALDQIGALTGPLIVAAALAINHEYRTGFAVLAFPALAAIATLFLARRLYPRPEELEVKRIELHSEGLPRVFWWYMAAAGLMALGYIDFPLIAFHWRKTGVAPDTLIPLLYSVAMGVDALAALLFGRLFDHLGIPLLTVAAMIGAAASPLMLLGGLHLAVVGAALWGIGMGAMESILRAAIVSMAPAQRRGSAYGIFNTAFGVCWFTGSALAGWLYDRNLMILVAFSVAAQLASIPFFLRARRRAY